MSLTAGCGFLTVDAARGDAGTGGAARIDGPHLPTMVNAPGTWSEEGFAPSPVAALGIATRTRPEGLFDERERSSMFAVSALDGSATWLRMPGFSLERWGFSGGFAVSPDGRSVGWVRPARPDRRGELRVAGWSILDTVTGDVRRLDVPGFSWVRGTVADLAFSGDSRYLLTSYETPDRARVPRSRGHQLVAWNVEDGSPTLVERAGHYWLPQLGSAPSTITWVRGRTVYRFDPTTGHRAAVRLPQDVVVASWGPDDTSFAYVGRPSVDSGPWRLHVGRTLEAAARTVVDLPAGVEPAQLLGWRDSGHVVVGHYRRVVHVIDVDTGAAEAIDMTGYGEQVNAPSLATALWSRPLVAPVDPRGTTDPRRPWRRTAGVAGSTACLAALIGIGWRGRRRRPARQG